MEQFSESWWAFGLALIAAVGVIVAIRRTRGKKTTGVTTDMGYQEKK